MELYTLTAAEMAEKMENGACSSREIVSSVFDRIRQVEPTVGGFITLCEESALEQADEVDRRRAAGEALAPLAGVPVGIKDNICTKGVQTTCGSKILENFVPPYNATVMDKLDAAGAVMVGKCNLDEFAMGSSCENSALQRTVNPHDVTRVPGGSSGGSAAAVAAGECAVALGSDTGGSVRLPASYCGVVGLKPTYGAVSRYGAVAFGSSIEQIGPFGRTVQDTAMLFQAICGQDKKDATSLPFDHPDFAGHLDDGVSGLVIGIPKEYFGPGVDARVADAVMKSVKELERMGATVREVSLPSTEYALSTYYVIACAEASSNLARFDGTRYGYRAQGATDLNDMYERTRSEGFGDEVKRRIMLGTSVLSSGYYDAFYKRAKLMQQKVSAEFAGVLSQCDCLITPTAPSVAFRLGENVDDPVKMYSTDVCTVTVSIACLPAISVPCGVDEGGMPMGMQIIGPKFSEARLFSIAQAHETISGGALAIPQLV